MKRLSILLFLQITLLCSLCADNIIDEVIWIVGDEAILRSEVEEERLRQQYEGQPIQGDPYCVIPEQLAVQKLFLHQAERRTIPHRALKEAFLCLRRILCPHCESK